MNIIVDSEVRTKKFKDILVGEVFALKPFVGETCRYFYLKIRNKDGFNAIKLIGDTKKEMFELVNISEDEEVVFFDSELVIKMNK